MPKEYESIRDSLMARGKSKKEAKSEAAAIWVKRHQQPFPKEAQSVQALKAK